MPPENSLPDHKSSTFVPPGHIPFVQDERDMERTIVSRTYILSLLTVWSQGRSESGCPRVVNGKVPVRLTVPFFGTLSFFLFFFFSFFLFFFSFILLC